MSEQPQESNVPHFLVTTEGELHGEDTPENREIVRRIHACVNACANLTTDELESGVVDRMREVIADVVPLLKERRNRGGSNIASPHMLSINADAATGRNMTSDC